MPPLKQPWRKRRALEAERRAVKEMEREMKEAKEKEKEVLSTHTSRMQHLGIL